MHDERKWLCNLREIREAHGLTVERLAAIARVEPDELRRIESGDDPRLGVAMTLAAWAGLGLWDIWQPRTSETSRQYFGAMCMSHAMAKEHE